MLASGVLACAINISTDSSIEIHPVWNTGLYAWDGSKALLSKLENLCRAIGLIHVPAIMYKAWALIRSVLNPARLYQC